MTSTAIEISKDVPYSTALSIHHVEFINLEVNDFSGTIPASIWSLPNLRFLYIRTCPNLSEWTLPTAIQNATTLSYADDYFRYVNSSESG